MMGRAPKEKHKRNENMFNILQTFDDDDTYSESEEGEVREYKIVVPPIVVDPVHTFQTVYQLIGTSHEFKRMSVGTKIVSPSLALYELAKNKLVEKKFTFFTHEYKDTKLFKLVLYGLPRIPVDEIKEELKNSYNVNVVNIKEITTSRSSADDALYALDFDRSQNTKSQVLKIRRLCSIVVHWRKPHKGNKGPTQCNKCAMYGHGARNCYRKSICIACGGEHDLANCQVNKTTQGSPAVYKCFNCIKRNLKNNGHRADDPRCPCRKEYMLIREKMLNKSRAFSRQPNPMPQENDSSFIQHEPLNNNPSTSYANVTQPPHAQHNELFSIDELFQIFTKSVSDLRNCRTKIEQLNVIMSMLKYAI